MKDKEFLEWLYERLVTVHGENPRYDYMYKLGNIIEATDPEQVTPNLCGPYPKSYWENNK